MAGYVVDAFALFCYDTDNHLLSVPFSSIVEIIFFAGKKSCLTKLTQKYRQRKQTLEWAYECIWEVRVPGQAASFQGYQTDIESNRWRLIKLKINLLNIAYAGSKAIK